MKHPFFIAIDDVYDDPDKVREYALNCEYGPYKTGSAKTAFDNGNANWEGKESIKPYPWSGNITQIASEVTGKKLFNFGPNSGKFRITKGSERNIIISHSDSYNDKTYAGIVYLNNTKPWECDHGTVLYKDAVEGIKLAREKGIYPADSTATKSEYWVPHLISNIVYNRLIIYKSNYFHGPAPPFGDTNEEARLVQIFFWTEDNYLQEFNPNRYYNVKRTNSKNR